jgi:hypothetical protein
MDMASKTQLLQHTTIQEGEAANTYVLSEKKKKNVVSPPALQINNSTNQ